MIPRLIRRYPVSTRRAARRALLALVLSVAMGVAYSWGTAAERTHHTTARLESAAERLDDLTDVSPADDVRRAAIAWGYAERLRLGLDSPLQLVEASARDPRLTPDERRTVAWGLLAHVLRGQTHQVDAATLDGLGPFAHRRSVPGELHLRFIERAILDADDPRSGELAVRYAYTLAAAERLVDGSAPVLAASVAALIADRELGRREALHLVRAAQGDDPIEKLRERRLRREIYVERPVLLSTAGVGEGAAIAATATLLSGLRAMRDDTASAETAPPLDERDLALAPRLYAAGAQLPPAAPLAVTIKRYGDVVRAQAPRVDADAFARTRNTEMLVAVTRLGATDRAHRRVLGRLLVASAVAMRSMAQRPVWFPGDSGPTLALVQANLGVASIEFDRDVPAVWHPYFLRELNDGIADLRRVLPGLNLGGIKVRWRMTSPADSALAMHDPRSRTLHLPVHLAGGALTHELAHDLDRQQALVHGHLGYRSDYVARTDARPAGRSPANGVVAASLRALAEEMAESGGAGATNRPAELFATRVDWFVAQSLASQGISNGFLSSVQDEVITGHVVHPDRLRTAGRSRALYTALSGMTPVAPFASQQPELSAHALMRWVLDAPLDEGVVTAITRGATVSTPTLLRTRFALSCESEEQSRWSLVWLAAEARARGILRNGARKTAEADRMGWERAALGQAPWSALAYDERVTRLRDYVLASVTPPGALQGMAGVAPVVTAPEGCD